MQKLRECKNTQLKNTEGARSGARYDSVCQGNQTSHDTPPPCCRARNRDKDTNTYTDTNTNTNTTTITDDMKASAKIIKYPCHNHVLPVSFGERMCILNNV